MSNNQDNTQGLDEILQELRGGYGTPEDTPSLSQAKQAILQWVSDEVVGEYGELVIPEYPRVDDEGEPLWSKRAAAESRKQITAKYLFRKELRDEQRNILKQHGWKEGR